MMLLVAIMAETGIFDFLAVFTFEVTKGKLWPLIYLLCAITAILSTFLDNVTTVLLMSPVTIRLCEVMELDPVPILMFMAIYSNIGGAATPVGDPPNDVHVVRERLERKIKKLEDKLQTLYKIRDKVLLIKSSVAIAFVVIVFFLHSIPELNRVSLGWTALLGAILLLTLADREDLEPILHRVSGMISAFVDNIPLTTMMVRVVVAIGSNPSLNLPLPPLIWALLFGACLGGNGTLIGASANVVCAGVAEQHGYKFTFARFFKVGFPIMVGHLVVSSKVSRGAELSPPLVKKKESARLERQILRPNQLRYYLIFFKSFFRKIKYHLVN
ncbi:hypothetical protein OBRU01_22738, partial [Operophtera brumata]